VTPGRQQYGEEYDKKLKRKIDNVVDTLTRLRQLLPNANIKLV
jgi:hypothetical protein